MADIPARLVKQLRDETGAGMMDCKRALEETGGDLEAARRLLRERGQAQAAKRASRETKEGKVGYRISDDRAAIVAVASETEPVSNNDEFLAFAKEVLEAVDERGPEAVADLEQRRVDLVARLGENIVVVGAARLERDAGETVAGYAHPPANKIGVLVKLRGGSEEVARRVAMHVAAAAPTWVRREEVPAEKVEEERQTLLRSDELQGKPEAAREKIVEGMLNKRFFAAYPGGVLLEQPWIHDSGTTVAKALATERAEVVEFVRYSVAG
ncbi:MAG: translation elongation factor Ts [Thermoleophilia bacterium]|nr:translation elongation factor Ts [Thermoleophilia bacterium]